MEYEYIYWRTGTGCLVSVLGIAVATALVAAVLMWAPPHRFFPRGGVWLVLLLWVAVYLPIMRLSFRLDRGRFKRLRVRERQNRSRPSCPPPQDP